MKKSFIHFYHLNEGDLKKIWDESIFIFDTNALLNLYNYSIETRDDWFKLLDQIKDRVFLPYNVGEEYHRNRISRIVQEKKINKDVLESFKKNLDGINSSLQEHKRFNEKVKMLDEHFVKIEKSIQEISNKYPDYLKDDVIQKFLIGLFEDKVGESFDEASLDAEYREGARRYKNQTPPGFSDEERKKEIGRTQFGDYIIWKQILNYSKLNQRSVIFITDDRKEDWWEKNGKNIVMPHPQLLKEFKQEVGRLYWQYRSSSFMEYAKKYLEPAIKEKTVEETRNVIQQSELAEELAFKVRVGTVEKIRESNITRNALRRANENHIFWQNLEKIRNELQLSDIEFARFIGISYSTFIRNRNNLLLLPLDSVFELSEKFNFHFEDLFKADFSLIIS